MSYLHYSSDLVASSPLLSKPEAHLVALTLTSAYVGGLYISRLPIGSFKSKSNAHPASMTDKDETPMPDLVEVAEHGELDRDDPRVIKSRVRAVTIATVGGCLFLGGIVYTRGAVPDVKTAASTTLRLLGLPANRPPLPNLEIPSVSTITSLVPSPSTTLTFIRNLPTTLTTPATYYALRPILPYVLAPTLFAGPLYTSLLDKSLPGQKFGRKLWGSREGGSGMFDCLSLMVPEWLRRLIGGEVQRTDSADLVMQERRRWIEFRNYIAGPITEEIVFRAAIIPTYVLADYTRPSDWKFLTFATPLWFGLAHVHHAYEVYKKGGRTRRSLLQAVVGSGFQLTYTTLFGWFAAYLFIKTDSIFPPIASHIFCNIMGLPDPVDAIGAYPSRKISIIGAYIAGTAGFVYGIHHL